MTAAEAGDDRPSVFAVIPEFTVMHRPRGGWRAWHRVDHDLVIDQATWLDLEAACSAARVARNRRITTGRTRDAGS
ncbi:hypothetical protein [Spirillospora sp. NBC_01491]|uniref:hypothetical protein n=1 Tax=Spirillospora sp. NBC_01491 TaxID=2976007 RepID=UPI002E300EF2|nr:hypothetical protein [Spirillospora sp. NBC_01491]